MSATQIGELTRRITIEAVIRTPDGAGGALESWAGVATVFAAVRPLGGGETLAFDRTTGRATHEVIIRYRDDVRPAMRLRMGTQIFEILSVLDRDGRRRHLRCLVEARDL